MRLVLHRTAAVLLAATLSLSLAGCGSTDEPEASPEPEHTGTGFLEPGAGASESTSEAAGESTGESTDAPDPSEDEQSARGDVFDRLPGAATTTALRLIDFDTSPTFARGDAGSLDVGGVVFAGDTAVLFPSSGYVVAYDLPSGARLWEHRVKRSKVLGLVNSSICATPTPPPGATAVAVLYGTNCGRLMSFDLATGAVVNFDKSQTAISSSGCGVVQVGDYTYWCRRSDDVLVRIEPDGTTSPVPGAEFGSQLPESRGIEHVLGSIDGDTVVLKTRKSLAAMTPDQAGDSVTQTDQGEYIGYRLTVGDEGTTAEQVFSVPAPTTVKGAVKDHTLTGNTEIDYGGLLVSLMGKRYLPNEYQDTRIGLLDPETGVVGDHVTFKPRDRPALYDGSLSARSFSLRDRTLYLKSTNDATYKSSISRYELDDQGGETVWTWAPKKGTYDWPEVSVVGSTPADDFLYASAFESYVTSTLYEIDASTGTTTRTWTVPEKVQDTLYGADLDTDGRYVVAWDVLFHTSGSQRPNREAKRTPYVAIMEIPAG